MIDILRIFDPAPGCPETTTLSEAIWRLLKNTKPFEYAYFPNDQIPEKIEPQDWYPKQILELSKQINFLKNADLLTLKKEFNRDQAARRESYQSLVEDHQDKENKKSRFLAELKTWKDSSQKSNPDLQEIIEEIEKSLASYNCLPPVATFYDEDQVEQWRTDQLRDLNRHLAYYQEMHLQSLERVAKQNDILKSLRQEFGNPPNNDPQCRCSLKVLNSEGCKCSAFKLEKKRMRDCSDNLDSR